MDLDEFYARGDARRQQRMDAMDRRIRRRVWGALLTIVGAGLAYYVIQSIVWGVS